MYNNVITVVCCIVVLIAMKLYDIAKYKEELQEIQEGKRCMKEVLKYLSDVAEERREYDRQFSSKTMER